MRSRVDVGQVTGLREWGIRADFEELENPGEEQGVLKITIEAADSKVRTGNHSVFTSPNINIFYSRIQ